MLTLLFPTSAASLLTSTLAAMFVLAVSGISICEACSARIISRMIRAISGEFSLAIASLESPSPMNGKALSRYLLLLSGSPVLLHFLTGDYSDRSSHLQCTSGGGIGVLEFVAPVAER
jgi:hypothetical protein